MVTTSECNSYRKQVQAQIKLIFTILASIVLITVACVGLSYGAFKLAGGNTAKHQTHIEVSKEYNTRIEKTLIRIEESLERLHPRSSDGRVDNRNVASNPPKDGKAKP